MNNLTYQILTLLISLLGVLLTYYVVPLLKSKISSEKLDIIEKWVAVAVAAAEQMKDVGMLTVDKKKYVYEFIKGKGITITDSELDALIEAAVYELNRAKNLLFKDLDLQAETTTETENEVQA